MNVATTGLSQGDFHVLRVLEANGQMTNILALVAAASASSSITANAPLNLTGDVLSIDLSAYASTVALNNALTAYTDTTNLTILLAGKQNTGAQASLVLRYSNAASDKNLTQGSLGQLLWNGAELQLKQNSFQQINSVLPISLSGSNNITIESLFKPSSVSLSAGVFGVANDNTGALALSGYDLKWLTNQTPSVNIKVLHFKSGFTLAETFDLATSQNELTIETTGVTDAEAKALIVNSVSATAGSGITSLGNPTSGAVVLNVDTAVLATRALVDPVIAKVSDLVDGLSGVSLGSGTGASQRCALFEIPASSNYFYGFGLCEISGNLPGVGIWASTAANVPRQNSSSGVDAHVMINTAGNMGINQLVPTEKLHVSGNILATGSITGSSKSFLITHPSPVKAALGYKLRHWSIETADCPGGLVQYRRTVNMVSTTQSFQMEDWFSHLVKQVTVHVNPFEHFGSAWGRCEGDTITLHATTLGKWHVLVVASRADDCAENCEQEVEFIPAPPTQTPEQSFPP